MSFNLNPTNKPSKLFFSTKSIKVVKTPCIMYVQYFGGVQYLGEYHDICVWCSVPEGYHEYCGVILSNVGGYHDAPGVIMTTVGCSVPWGEIFCYLSTQTILNTPPRYS